MNFSIGCDHAGPAYKKAISELLINKGHVVYNKGTDIEESVDYPDHAHAVAEDVESEKGFRYECNHPRNK